MSSDDLDPPGRPQGGSSDDAVDGPGGEPGSAGPHPESEEIMVWGSERPLAAPASTAVETAAYDVRRPPTRHARGSSRRGRSRRPRRRRSRRGTGRPRVSLVRRLQRAWHEHPVRTRVILVVAVLAIASVAILADAYWQTYRAYADMRQAIPKIQQAKSSLVRGRIPAPEVFDAVSAAASRASYDVEHANFTFRLVGAIPGLNRPIEAARWGSRAADEEAEAITDLRDLLSDVLGSRALQSGEIDKTDLPIYRNGAINVELLDSLAPRMDRLIGHLRAGEAAIERVPSVPFFGKVERLKAQALAGSHKAVELLQNGENGVRLLPSFLGAHGTRTYFVALQNNVDQRGTGGAVLGYAIIRLDHGRLQLLHGGGINEIDDKNKGLSVPNMPAGVRWYLNETGTVARINNGANYSPNFPMVAATWVQMAERASGLHIDGAIALDPFAISDALRGQGQFKIPAFPQRIDSDNVVPLVGHLQYALPRQAQIDLPGQLIAGAFKKLEQPKDFYKMATGLGAAIPGRHVQVWVADRKQEDLVRRLGWDGALSQAKGDFLALAYEKRLAGKQDFWTRHAIDYDVRIKPSGAIDSSYTIHVSDDITSGAPGRMVPHVHPYGLNVAMYNLYVPGRATFGSVSPNDAAFPTDFVSPSHFVSYIRPKGFVQHAEGPYRVFTQTVTPYPGHPGTVRFRYTVPHVVQQTADGRVYRLNVDAQPLFHPATMHITVHLPPGATVSSPPPGWTVQGNTLRAKVTLDRDYSAELHF
jgi:hypothetical protein